MQKKTRLNLETILSKYFQLTITVNHFSIFKLIFYILIIFNQDKRMLDGMCFYIYKKTLRTLYNHKKKQVKIFSCNKNYNFYDLQLI